MDAQNIVMAVVGLSLIIIAVAVRVVFELVAIRVILNATYSEAKHYLVTTPAWAMVLYWGSVVVGPGLLVAALAT